MSRLSTSFVAGTDFLPPCSFITLPFLARDQKAIEIVQVILESILLRREKNMRDSEGNKIVDLPAKEVSLTQYVLSGADLFRCTSDQCRRTGILTLRTKALRLHLHLRQEEL